MKKKKIFYFYKFYMFFKINNNIITNKYKFFIFLFY